MTYRIALPLLFLYLATIACSLTSRTMLAAPVPSTPSPTPTYQPETPQPIPSATPTPSCIVTTGIPDGRVNLRACPSMSCAVLAVVVEGETLQVVTPGEPGGWHEVQTGATTGYVYSRFCK